MESSFFFLLFKSNPFPFFIFLPALFLPSLHNFDLYPVPCPFVIDSGPVVLGERLAKYAPVPFIRKDEKTGKYSMTEFVGDDHESLGRLRPFVGQMGMFVRALVYSMAYGVDGLRAVSGDAVLNANYLLNSLNDVLTPAFDSKRCMHECLFNDSFLNGTKLTTLDFAKSLIDEGLSLPLFSFSRSLFF